MSKEVKFDDLYDKNIDPVWFNKERGLHGEFFLVARADGALHCSCGRNLEEISPGVYQCAGGWPTYRPAAGEVIIDKFGNLMIKVMPHGIVSTPNKTTEGKFSNSTAERLPSRAPVADWHYP